jgi:hypothetical protein
MAVIRNTNSSADILGDLPVIIQSEIENCPYVNDDKENFEITYNIPFHEANRKLLSLIFTFSSSYMLRIIEVFNVVANIREKYNFDVSRLKGVAKDIDMKAEVIIKAVREVYHVCMLRERFQEGGDLREVFFEICRLFESEE